MAIIYTYPTKNATASDKVLISDSEDELKTKQAPVSSIKDAIDVVDSIVAGTGISVSSATGNVTISTPAYSGGGNIGHVPSGGTNSSFLRGDGTWAAPTSISLTTTGTSGASTLIGTTLNIPQYSGDTYSISAGTKSGSTVPLNLDAASGSDSAISLTGGTGINLTRNSPNQITIDSTATSGVSSFTNGNGTYISAAIENTAATGAVSTGIIDLSATGIKDDTTFLRGDNRWSKQMKNGFNTFTIYDAADSLDVIEESPAVTIIRQSVVEVDCKISHVAFMRFLGQDPISVFVYSGTISGGGNLVLSGSQAAPNSVSLSEVNTVNNIEFVDSDGNPKPQNFSAGENIVIVCSFSPGGVGGGVSIAGKKSLLSNVNVSRENNQFMIPAGFTSPNAPNDSLSDFLTNTSASSATSSGVALHFYDKT